ncbi:MAG: hypothetical protein MZV70_00045 [Desulfobacterales bacterium]|nr:hypothetical protein [Desulfobacterales bacterium]
MIWRRLAEQARLATVSPDDLQDQEIINEVCSGHLGRLSELTNLTLRAARCLAESGAMELFMNRLEPDLPGGGQKTLRMAGAVALPERHPPAAARCCQGPLGMDRRTNFAQRSERAAGGGRCRAGRVERPSTGAHGAANVRGAGTPGPVGGRRGKLYVPDGVRKEIGQLSAKGRPPASKPGPGRF